jgi:hypothetical protein
MEVSVQDIQSSAFAEKISNLLDEVKSDARLKKQLLNDPEKYLASHDIVLKDYQIIVEERPGYGLFFAVQPKKMLHPKDESLKDTPDSFQNLHFLDCLHY